MSSAVTTFPSIKRKRKKADPHSTYKHCAGASKLWSRGLNMALIFPVVCTLTLFFNCTFFLTVCALQRADVISPLWSLDTSALYRTNKSEVHFSVKKAFVDVKKKNVQKNYSRMQNTPLKIHTINHSQTENPIYKGHD